MVRRTTGTNFQKDIVSFRFFSFIHVLSIAVFKHTLERATRAAAMMIDMELNTQPSFVAVIARGAQDPCCLCLR